MMTVYPLPNSYITPDGRQVFEGERQRGGRDGMVIHHVVAAYNEAIERAAGDGHEMLPPEWDTETSIVTRCQLCDTFLAVDHEEGQPNEQVLVMYRSGPCPRWDRKIKQVIHPSWRHAG